MSVDLGKGSLPSTPGRYPKRKRATISYTEPADTEEVDSDTKPDDDKGADAPDAEEDDHQPTSDEEPEYGTRTKVKRAPPKKKKKAAVPRPPPEPKPFPFMSLPPELRNKIYDLALIDHVGIHIISYPSVYRRVVRPCPPLTCRPARGQGSFHHQEWLKDDGITPNSFQAHAQPHLVPALLRLNKAIYAEAAAMLWGQKFYFADAQALHTFLRPMRPETKALMRDITIIHWSNNKSRNNSNVSAFDLLIGAKNLQRLHIFDVIVAHGWRYSRRRGVDGDTERAKVVARKLYADCYDWLDWMVKTCGEESVVRVLKVSPNNYKPDTRYGGGAGDSQWTDERTRAGDTVLFSELLHIRANDL